MSSLTKAVIDCGTGEAQQIPLTEEEIAQLELDKQNAQARLAEEEAIAAEKAAALESAKTKLAAIGLTEAEIASLLNL
jgi:hypothetical protein